MRKDGRRVGCLLMWTDKERLYLRHIFKAQQALDRALQRMCPDAGPTPDQEAMLEAIHETCNTTRAILKKEGC